MLGFKGLLALPDALVKASFLKNPAGGDTFVVKPKTEGLLTG